MIMADGNKKPYLAVLLIQTIYAGMFLLSKAAFNGGMNNFVYVFYRQAAATVILVPLAVISERKRAPPLSLIVFCKIFMVSLFGISMCMNMYGIALIYTSATLAAATSNTLPVITFFLAILLRMEKVNLRTRSGTAKVMGVVLCTLGAIILALYKGPQLKPMIHHHPFGHPTREDGHAVEQSHFTSNSSSKTWIKGCFFMLIANILWGLWLVLQVPILKNYPSKLLSTALQCFLSTIQSFIIALAFERNSYQWKLHLDVGLLAVTYSGIVVTGVTFYLQAWCIEKKGPVFLAMSTPLSLIITIISSSFLLGELISLGSVVGGVVLVGGLYSVLWGKSREQQQEDDDDADTLTILEDGNNKDQEHKDDCDKLGVDKVELGSNPICIE